VIESSHREVGARLAGRWGLPEGVARAIAHQDDFDYRGGAGSITNLVRVANALCQREGLDLLRPPVEQTLRTLQAGQRVLQLSAESLEHALSGVQERVDEVMEESETQDTQVRMVS
jgi:HD-like signal output (HDOD) protein